ncbi:MAG: glutaredoxin 3 [Pseudomonadota bacterium]
MAPVTIYTRKFCPYCTAAKQLLKAKGASYEEFDATMDRGLKAEMVKRAKGGSTFPQIFIGEQHVGGCDELYALEDAGKLDKLLAA